MQLAELTVCGLRGIEDETFTIYDFTTFIGPNNSGKSTVLRSLQLLLNQEKPAHEEWHVNHINEPITITGRFTDITEAERNIPGISSLVYNAEIRLRLTITKGDKAPDLNYTAFIRDEHIEGWSDSWRSLSEEVRTIAESLGFNGAAWRTKANQERIRQYIRENHADLVEYGDPDWTDEGISIKEALKQGLPRVEIVPAVRDAKDEGQLTQKKNIFAEILENSIFPEVEATDEYRTIVQKADDLSQRITGTGDNSLEQTNRISTEISNAAGAVIDLKVLFRLDPPDMKKIIGSGARIRLSDGTETPVHFQGHGAQRTLIYALVRYIAQQRATGEERTRPVTLLFEEPEIYVHPQLLRALRQSLKEVASLPDWQVLVTTHSPIMVDVADVPQSLIIMRRNADTRAIESTQLDHDPFEDEEGVVSERQMLRAMLDFHPTVCEAFFANRALLVEGDSEMAILRFRKEALFVLTGEQCDVENTTVISCGGKWTIIPIARLLTEFGIPCKVIHDLDRKGLSDAELEGKPPIHPFKANLRIANVVGADKVYVVDDTLEDIMFPPGEQPSDKDKPFTAWKRMSEILDRGELSGMEALANLFRFAIEVNSDSGQQTDPGDALQRD